MKNKNTKCQIMINNYPSYELREYTVVKGVEHAFWFYGTYDDEGKAFEVAKALGNGFVVKTGR